MLGMVARTRTRTWASARFVMVQDPGGRRATSPNYGDPDPRRRCSPLGLPHPGPCRRPVPQLPSRAGPFGRVPVHADGAPRPRHRGVGRGRLYPYPCPCLYLYPYRLPAFVPTPASARLGERWRVRPSERGPRPGPLVGVAVRERDRSAMRRGSASCDPRDDLAQIPGENYPVVDNSVTHTSHTRPSRHGGHSTRSRPTRHRRPHPAPTGFLSLIEARRPLPAARGPRAPRSPHRPRSHEIHHARHPRPLLLRVRTPARAARWWTAMSTWALPARLGDDLLEPGDRLGRRPYLLQRFDPAPVELEQRLHRERGCRTAPARRRSGRHWRR